ncbi:bifunctional glycosyltransferase/CDP-glycerol:glycerophosphate glycerophosphotransferase [Streptomyces sp. enrichment culture]|uniref:bifunctional glycosyltransferase/CDP-glycerol:glycerophosphate glycerophosphotransferase n=1 Tax=Streptomyces sp. enrichment culture TaxID=1795815 RepID=UPI003F5488B2
MPRFSVIVPAYQVQAYLHACLESVLSQSWPDLELIAVDDGSPDACGEIVDEFAARDPRVRAVHLPRNQGPGPARNAGMERARGDYLLFLDGDDTLTPGALRAVAARLRETGEPDVLVHGWARVDWSDEPVRGDAAVRPAASGPAPFRLADRPGLLSAPAPVWDKVCRRAFVAREGFAFPPGHYEDTPWTCPVLLRAESIAALDRVCVHHRRRRYGDALATPGAHHFDVFAQYDRLFAFLDSDPRLAPWRPVLYRRMAGHLAALADRPGLLPRGTRTEFLRRARAHCRRHRVPRAAAPPRVRLRHALLRLGLYRTHRTLRRASAPVRGASKGLAVLLRATRAAVLWLHHRLQRLLPLRADRAVFTAHDGRGCGGDPGALEQAFREFAPHVRTAWIAPPALHHTLPPGPRRLAPGTAAALTALARSRYVVHDTRLGGRLVKRRGQVVVHTPRGAPLRPTGPDLLPHPAARAADVARLLRDVDTWDHVVSADRHSTLTWQRVLPGRCTTLEYGRPRTDVLHRATAADVARLRSVLGVPEGAVAILYAPADRGHHDRAGGPGLDLERVLRRLGPHFVVLARPRSPYGGPLVPGTDRVIDVGGHPRVESLCLASDVLLTDCSPLVFDYAVLDRPIVLCAGDGEALEAARGACVDLRSCPPGAVARGEDELVDLFATGHWRGSHATRLRRAFRERFCPYDDGRVAERVVRRVVLGESDLPPLVPPAAWRPAPGAAASTAGVPPATVPQPAGPHTVTESL